MRERSAFLIPSEFQAEELVSLAESILRRFDRNLLTRVPMFCLDELPKISGVYIAVNESKEVFYVGMSSDLHSRCKLASHQKLPLALEMGAAYLLIASVPREQAWFVEQVLIDRLKPSLNELLECWWERYNACLPCKPSNAPKKESPFEENPFPEPKPPKPKEDFSIHYSDESIANLVEVVQTAIKEGCSDVIDSLFESTPIKIREQIKELVMMQTIPIAETA